MRYSIFIANFHYLPSRKFFANVNKNEEQLKPFLITYFPISQIPITINHQIVKSTNQHIGTLVTLAH
ncbi:hypothetical protein D7D25_00465 [Proteiniphilum sp. X52]|nr:hypothetical protein D7D25_00465 [Proteiniphilum sp. X52]